MMIVCITVETIVGMMSIAVMMMTMEKDICWCRNHRILRLHLLNIPVIGGWDSRRPWTFLYFSYWGLGRSEGLEQRRVLQRAEAWVGGVSEDEVGPGEEVGGRHPDLPQALLVLRPKEELILFTHTSRPSTSPKISSKKTNPHKISAIVIQKRHTGS